MTRRITSLVGAAILAGTLQASAQTPMHGGGQKDATIDAATRAAVVESLATSLDRMYVFPDRGRAMAKALRGRLSSRQYDRITSAMEFGDSLTAHMQAVSHDKHLRCRYSDEVLPRIERDGTPSPDEVARMRQDGMRVNFGFEGVRRLRGNVGYLDLRQFSGDPAAQNTAVVAMQFLANTDALIVDLRRNGGGSPAMIQTLLTYLTSDDDRLHINDFYQRATNDTVQFWTASYVPGSRYRDKPVYVLTSARTFSAAEEFAYDVQTHTLGTIVGETSGGGAHPGEFVRLSDHYMAFVATGRAINPVTKTNWEGVGVQPNVACSASEALKVAHVAAIKKLLDGVTDADRREALTNALEAAEKTLPDPAEDFLPPGRSVQRR